MQKLWIYSRLGLYLLEFVILILAVAVFDEFSCYCDAVLSLFRFMLCLAAF